MTSIAKKFNTKINSIVKHNSLNKNNIKTGNYIFIPDAKIIKNNNKLKNNAKKKSTVVKNEIIKSKFVKINKTFVKSNNPRIKKPNFIWPLKGRITSSFGLRNDPFTGRKKFHCGIDIGANEGTRVNAAKKGKVIFSGWKTGYGKIIVIKHQKGYITVYAHLSKLLKKVNELVNSNDIIALSGKTGAVTGAHLHFEIRKYLTPLNPIRILKRVL